MKWTSVGGKYPYEKAELKDGAWWAAVYPDGSWAVYLRGNDISPVRAGSAKDVPAAKADVQKWEKGAR